MARATSRNLTARLSFGPHSDPSPSRFVATVREALAAMPNPGTRIHRMRYQPENCLTALEGALREALGGGASVAQVQRVRDAISRATDDLVRQHRPGPVLCLTTAIRNEILVDGRQDMDAAEVLIDGSLADVERLYESTRLSRDACEALLEACAQRSADLRREAERQHA